MKTLLFTLLFSFTAILLSCGGPNASSTVRSRISEHNHSQPQPSNSIYSDAIIIENLKQHYRLEPREMGGGGRCLFHSLREQITQSELMAVKAKWPKLITDKIDTYATLSDDAKANLLREVAIWEEKDFLDTKNKKTLKYHELSLSEQVWVQEMAKDWHQEIIANIDNTRTWFSKNIISNSGRQDMWQFVIDHRDAYWARTSCETNWAGTAEAIAIARAINRPLKMFGLDLASSLAGPQYDDSGRVLPYIEYLFSGPGKTLMVLQTNGGGHYKMLVSIPL